MAARLPLLQICILCLLVGAALTQQHEAADRVELEIPHNTRVGQKLFRNAPWLHGVDMKNVIDGHHEWFSLIKDKGDHHLQVNGYLHRLAGQVLQLELLNSDTRELARLLRIFIAPPAPHPASVESAEPPALKYLADAPPPSPAHVPAAPAQPQQLPKDNTEAEEPQFLVRVRRQSATRTIFRVNENMAPASLLFAAVTPTSSTERYVFKTPSPDELTMDPTSSNVYLKMDQTLSFVTKPSILFSVLVQTSDGRGLYRVQDCEIQVQKVADISPVISTYTTFSWTVLYRETSTLDGAITYIIRANNPGSTAANLTYEFIPGMEGRPEGRFRVVPNMGLLVTMRNDVWPAPKYYDVGVRAVNLNSGSPLSRYGYALVRVYTTYQPPQFSRDAFTFYLMEETDPTRIGQISCQSINNMWSAVTITAAMEPGTAAVLSMDSNGNIFSLARLDYDNPLNPKTWFFTAFCTENSTSATPRTSEVQVTVQLVDINDNRPYFFLDYYIKPDLTREDVALNSEVFRVQGLDADSTENAVLVYTVGGASGAMFNVTRDPVTREAIIRLQGALDYEALPLHGKQYIFTLTVSDGVTGVSIRPSTTVIIPVQNVNDNPPIIRNFTSVVDKNSPSGTNLIQMQVADLDGSAINYYFWTGTATTSQYPSTSNNLFAINQITGLVSIGTASRSSLRDASFVLPYRAIDDGTCSGCPIGTPLSSDIGYLTLTVIDTSNVAPVFTNCPTLTTTVSYTDNAPVGTSLITMNAIDPSSAGATIEYAIMPNTLNPAPEGFFVINSTTGDIISSSIIDIDVLPVVTLRNYFWLTVRAINKFNRLTTYCSFQVSYVDINDQVPMFDSDKDITRVISLTTPSGTTIGQVSAFDPDVPDSPMSTVNYFIVASNPPAGMTLFSISSLQNLGTITTAGTFGGYADKSRFALTIEARNPVAVTGTTKPWNNMTFTVWLTTQSKLLPPLVSANPPNYLFAMNEDIASSSLIINMTASSPVADPTRTYEWSEPTRANYVPTNAASDLHFGLRSSTSTACTSDTCSVAVSGTFDYQNYRYFYARSRVSYKDRDSEIGEIYTEVYKCVSIQDVNNRWPDFITRQYVTTVLVIENSVVGTTIAQAFAVDLDSLTNFKKVVYTLDQTVSNDYRFFSIDGDTGTIRTAAPPTTFDAEGNKTLYDLQVNASDSFHSSLPGVIGPNAKTLRLSVITRDINDNNPYFPRSYAFSIRDDSPLDTTVGIANATDPDVGDTLRYSISGGDPNYQFMSVVQTGEIKVAKALSYDIIPFYSLIFTVTDGKNTATTTVNITVIDVTNHAPVFNPSFVNITNVTEGDPARQIWRLTAFDTDSTALTYSLSGKWAAAPTMYFTVDSSTGMLSTTRPLDREESPVYRFNAMASDGSLIAYAEVNVWPIDINDNRPTWNYTSLHGRLMDSSPVGTSFMQLSVIDPDITGTITCALVANSSDGSEYVTVNTNGVVVTTSALGVADKERYPPKAPFGLFYFIVTATDGVGSAITGTATVTIVDVNDNAPVFDRTLYTVNIPETTEINDNVFTAAASDVDIVDLGKLNYTLPDNPAYFKILNLPTINAGAVLLAQKLDYEDASIPKSFSFRIVVIDSNPPAHSVTCSLSINVIDVNDNTPVITFTPGATVTKQEGPLSLGLLVSFSATDADPSDTVFIFSILSDSDPYGNLALSGVTANSGSINVQVALDREAWNPPSTDNAAMHMYVLLASDQRGRTGTATLTVMITDINDSAPTLPLPTIVTIMENTPIGTIAQPTGITGVDRDSAANGPPFTYAQDMTAGNNWVDKFALVASGSGFNIQSAKVFDRERDGKQFLLQVLITDMGGLTGTGTVTVIIGDVDDNSILSNGYKQVYVYIYEGNEDYWFNTSTRLSVGFASVVDLDDWDRSTKTYTLTTTTKYFELARYGEVFLKGGTPANNYSLIVEVRDSTTLAYCQFVVTLTVLPNDAVTHSGSMIIDNIDPQAFVERAVIPSTYSLTKDVYPDYAFSAYDYFKLNLSAVLSTTFNKVHIFVVDDVPGSRSIFLRFTALGSPYYFSTRLASLVALNKDLLIKTLSNYAATLRMIPVDQCRLESDGLPSCRRGCRNALTIATKDPVSKIYNSTALIGINAAIQTACGCEGDAYVPPTTCTYGTCFHDGNCTTIPGSYSFTCACPTGYEGPRCEVLSAGFTTEESFLVLPSFPGACMNIHISLYFLTVQSASSVLLLYTGAANLTAPTIPEKDFLALELINGRPKLTIDLGGGPSSGGLHTSATAAALNDGKWHRIDIFITNQNVVLKVDRCETAPTVLDGDPAPPNLTSCQYYWTVSGSFSKLNVGSFPVFLGGRFNIRSTTQYATGLATTGFIGQVAKLRFNSRLYDLYVGSRTWLAAGAVSNFPPTLSSCTWSDGSSKCQNGWCWGIINGAVGSGACMCYNGYRLDANGRCTIALDVVELKASSYMFYKAKAPFFSTYVKQGIKLDIQFRTRATNGTLLIVTGNDPYRPEHMELGLRNSSLVYRHNLGDFVYRDLVLPNGNVSDGAWHWVQIIRRLTDVELIMDHGDYYNYAFMFGNYTSTYNNIILGDLAAVGAIVSLSTGSPRIDPPETDLQNTCISTVRVNEAYFPVLTSGNSDAASMATLDYSVNMVSGCDSGVACPAGVTCPATMICLPAWRPLSPPVCGCADGYILYAGVCYPIACLYNNPCVNGICALVGGLPKCTCNVGWQGDTCAAPAFAVGSASLIIILVLLAFFLLLLAAFLIWFCCFAGGKKEPLLIDVPYENVMEYNEEGGGQEDKLNFDMAQLRVMVSDTTVVKERVTALQTTRTDFQSLLQSRLALANAGPEPSPFDGVLDYEYEGRGAKADDLDSIVSGDDNTTQSFEFLQAWGPKFERITTIYTTLPDNADDLQSVSEFAGPSAAVQGNHTMTTTTTTTTTRRV